MLPEPSLLTIGLWNCTLCTKTLDPNRVLLSLQTADTVVYMTCCKQMSTAINLIVSGSLHGLYPSWFYQFFIYCRFVNMLKTCPFTQVNWSQEDIIGEIDVSNMTLHARVIKSKIDIIQCLCLLCNIAHHVFIYSVISHPMSNHMFRRACLEP